MPHNITRKLKLPSVPKITHINKSILPGEDYYMFINSNWLKETSIPSYLSSFGVSEEIEQIVNDKLLHIVYDCREHFLSDKHPSNNEYLLGVFTESIINTKNNEGNIKFLEGMVSSLKCIRDKEEIASTIGDFIRHRVPTVINVDISPTESDSDYIRVILTPNIKFGLPDLSYYHPGFSKTKIIGAYASLLNRLGNEFNTPGLEQVFGIEEIIANSIQENDSWNDIIMTRDSLKKRFKNIPWDILFHSIFSWTPSEKHIIVIKNKRYFSNLNKWFLSFPLETWKLLFSSQIILHMLPVLPSPFNDWYYELYEHQLRGQSEKRPKNILTLHLAKQWLGNSLGNVYINSYVSTKLKRKAINIAKEIKNSAAEIAGSTIWLEPSTRKKAVAKVQSIYLGVAYPSVIHNDKRIKLHPEKLLENILHLAESDFINECKKIDKKLTEEEWDDDVFAVNAYYYNEANRLILPAGILQWPFFHEAASDGWNFGGIGASIGHEISHAFDNDGKDYDEYGNRNPWWSRAEQMRYHKKTKALIEIYNKTLYFDQHLNGVLTLSENIADLGGVQIALNALKKRLKNRNASEKECHEQICDFFHSFAVSWRTKEKKEKALQSLFMDVHAPPPARVNNIVRQFDEWYTCYNIQPGHKLYTEPSERIRIF
jgi:putative endopeptidase